MRLPLHSAALAALACPLAYLAPAASGVGQIDRGRPAAERPYVPPTALGDHRWETLDPAGSGWDLAALTDLSSFLDSTGTRAFIVLSNGRIVVEEYYGAWTRDRLHPVFSCTKSMVATLVRQLIHEGSLGLNDPVTQFLGQGWSNAPTADESEITVRHLLEMTSGLDEGFHRVAAPGAVWLYNTPVYRELWDVLEAATGTPREAHAEQYLWQPIGMNRTRLAANGEYALSTGRDLARFGLVLLRGGRWDRDTYILARPGLVERMTSPSQDLNPAYGELFWVNGQDRFELPDGTVAKGPIFPSAPSDTFAALGALDQKVYVVPSRDLVVVRIGASGQVPGGGRFDELMWQHLRLALPPG